ncbi:hypothetical protein ANN_13142 [Periplaneta americana]|uniref:DUF659 domain-containing protein n=1 Tax=Periplaneta americana TaxID=6978 RepID=A0ABQ8TKK9_PERAM|nr:hypothetical protein ANN_13142 [Periplaneta americana]
MPKDKSSSSKYSLKSWLHGEKTLISDRKRIFCQVRSKKVLHEIRNDIGDSLIWVSVDETTDSCGRYVANVFVGKMDSIDAGSPHLIMCTVSEKTNHATIARTVKYALRLLWPTTEHEERLLALTNNAAYVLKAAGTLQVIYPKMIHITCIVHSLHRTAEEIRSQHPKPNNLISSVKKAFVKVLHLLNPEGAACINSAILADDVGIQSELSYIGAHIKTLPETMTKLEERGLQLTTAMSLLNTVTTSFNKVPESLGTIQTEKMKKTEERNPDLETVKNISGILQGEPQAVQNYTPKEIAAFKYCPLNSCEVESTFSVYQNILADSHRRGSVG